MNKLYLIREYGIINMCDTVIIDCYVAHKIPDNAIDESKVESPEFDRMLSVHDIVKTYEDVSDYIIHN